MQQANNEKKMQTVKSVPEKFSWTNLNEITSFSVCKSKNQLKLSLLFFLSQNSHLTSENYCESSQIPTHMPTVAIDLVHNSFYRHEQQRQQQQKENKQTNTKAQRHLKNLWEKK